MQEKFMAALEMKDDDNSRPKKKAQGYMGASSSPRATPNKLNKKKKSSKH